MGQLTADCTSVEHDQKRMVNETAEEQPTGKKLGTVEKHGEVQEMSKIIRTAATESFVPEPDDDMIICRCEEITKGEIRKAVHEGMRTTNEVKRWLRCGMGLCQGQTCQRNVQNIVAKESGLSVKDLGMITGRTPARPVVMETYANDILDVKE